MIRPAFETVGISGEAFDTMLGEWAGKGEAVDYKALDEAIESGEGISEEIANLKDKKKEQDIIDHILNAYSSSVDLEETLGTDTSYRDSVETALQGLNPEFTYEEQGAAYEARQVAKPNVIKAVDSGNAKDIAAAVKAYADTGKDVSTLKSDLTNEFKTKWVEAYKAGDSKKAAQITQAVIAAKVECNRIKPLKSYSTEAKSKKHEQDEWSKKTKEWIELIKKGEL